MVESKKWVPQVIENAHEDDEVELPLDFSDFVDGTPLKLDLEAQGSRCVAALVQVTLIHIDPEHPVRTAALHLNGVETAIAPNIENRSTGQIFRDGALYVFPLHAREVAEEMVGSCW